MARIVRPLSIARACLCGGLRRGLALALAGYLAGSLASSALGTDLAPPGPVVLSEIQYHPPARLGADELYEFVEIANRSDAPVDVSGWRLKDRDDGHSFVLPPGTVLPPGGYLVIARDAAALTAAYGGAFRATGDFDFALGNGGDTVRLLDARGALADRVEYEDDIPWPQAAAGDVSTLERISLLDDATDFTNFAASAGAALPGTPGAPNTRAGAIAGRHAVVVNEILYNPVEDPAAAELRHCAAGEFVELLNRGATPIDISGWSFASGIELTFPEGTVLEGGAYVVLFRDQAAFRGRHGDVPGALGPFLGDLDDGGEPLLLVDREGRPADHVDYNDAPPWPALADGLEGSLELVDPASDNDRGRAWRASESFLGTPGRENAAAARARDAGGNRGPEITSVAASPEDVAEGAPARPGFRSDDRVRVEAMVHDADGVAAVRLEHQPVAPGDYIRRSDPRFELEWTAVEMALDPERGVWAAVLPPFPHRTLVRYRVAAEDAPLAPRRAVLERFPFPDDPEPNLAYLVYDGVPDYVADERSAFGPPGHVHTGLTGVPVYHLISAAEDLEALQYERRVEDNTYPWRVTFAHEDKVHDHCGIRLRGEADSRYGAPKRSFRIKFNKGNLFRGRYNDGTPYAARRTKTNLMTEHVLRGDGGVLESLAWKLYRDAGVLAAGTAFVHLRAIRSREEGGQFDGDFLGLFVDTQSLDASALREQGRPADEDSRLYAYEGGPERRHPDCEGGTDDADEFLGQALKARSPEELAAILDVPSYLSFRAATELADNHDMDSLKNFFHYYSSATRRWEVAPWDLDHVLGGNASGDEPLRARALLFFFLEYQSRYRLLWQLHYEEERLYGVIDRWRSLLGGLPDADRDRWDTEPREACPNWPSPGGGQCGTYGAFAARMAELRTWLANRSAFARGTVLDRHLPETPRSSFPPPGSSPSPPLRLASLPFADPDGDGHARSHWLVIEEGGDWAFPLWELVTEDDLLETALPEETFFTGRRYSFRVRHEDTTGRSSFFSTPTSFAPGSVDHSPPSAPPAPRLEGAGHRSVLLSWAPSADSESGILGYAVLRDGARLDAALTRGERYRDHSPRAGSVHEYRVRAVNEAGLESEPSPPLRVEVPAGALGGWAASAASWDYFYDARPGEDACPDPRLTGPGELDGTWRRAGISRWDGGRPGDAEGAPGGAAIDVIASEAEDGDAASVLSLEDPGDPPAPVATRNNGRLYFLRELEGGDPFAAGLTLIARLRVHPAPLDLPAPGAPEPDPRTLRGHLGVAYSAPGVRRRLSLWLDAGGLRTLEGPGVELAPASLLRFRSLWVTVGPAEAGAEGGAEARAEGNVNGPEGGGHRLRVFLDGSGEAAVDSPITLSTTDAEIGFEGAYLEMGLSNGPGAGALQIDYVGYRSGVHLPASAGAPGFVRGDANLDGALDQLDALVLLSHLFARGRMPSCPDAADADDSGRLAVTDAVAILGRVAGLIAALPPPFPACGEDLLPDALERCGAPPCPPRPPPE